MTKQNKYVPIVIRISIALLFLLSAVAKLYPSPYFAISTFEVKQLYPLGFSQDLASYFSRILIGIEFALGILILQKHYLRKLVIPATLLMLAIFTTHLSIVTFQDGGNSGNCGCFGSLLPMTPVQAILKNILAIALLVVLLKVMPQKDESKSNFWILSTWTLTVIALLRIFPLILLPAYDRFIPLPTIALLPATALEPPRNPGKDGILSINHWTLSIMGCNQPTKEENGFEKDNFFITTYSY